MSGTPLPCRFHLIHEWARERPSRPLLDAARNHPNVSINSATLLISRVCRSFRPIIRWYSEHEHERVFLAIGEKRRFPRHPRDVGWDSVSPHGNTEKKRKRRWRRRLD